MTAQLSLLNAPPWAAPGQPSAPSVPVATPSPTIVSLEAMALDLRAGHTVDLGYAQVLVRRCTREEAHGDREVWSP